MLNKLKTLLLLMVIPFVASAQFTIEGQVVDSSSNQSLPSAHISLEGTFKTAVSDLNGHFQIDQLKSGKYLLRITYLGYEDFTQSVELKQNVKLVVQLKTSSLLEDEVIVYGTRASDRTGTTFKNITKAELKKADIGQDLPYILALTPSVVSSSDAGAGVGYTSIRIRGTDISRINVTLNGIPINDPESQGVWWVNMPDLTSSLSSIQIQRGVGTSSNGAAAFGASINMLSADLNQKPYAEVNTAYGLFNTQRYRLAASSGLIDGKWSFDTRLSKVKSDGYVDRASSNLSSYFVSGAYYGKKSILRLNVFSGKEITYQSWAGIPKDSLATNPTYNPYTYENEVDNYQQDHFQLLYSYQANSFWNINAALHYTKGRGYYESWKDDRKLADYGISDFIIGSDTIRRTDLVQQKWLDNDFYGLTFSADYNNKKDLQISIGGAANQYDGEHYGKIIWAEYALMGKDYEWYRNNGLKNTYNLYAKANYQLTDKFNIFGDLQYRKVDYWMSGIHDDFKDLNNDYHFNFINPKIGLNYIFSNKQQAYFSAAIAQKEPGRNDFRDADFNKIPLPELLVDYELGYSYSMQNYLIRANAFYMDYTNQLVMTGKVNNVGAPIMTNVDKSYRAGVELVFGTIITKWLSWNANLTLSQNKIKNYTEFVDNWDTWSQDSTQLGTTDIAYSPNVVAASQFQLKPIKNVEIFINTKYVGKQYIDNSSNDYNSIDAYTTTDLMFRYTMKNKWIKLVGINFSINNIFNAQYASNAWVYSYNSAGERGVIDGYFPQAGINFMLGLDLKF